MNKDTPHLRHVFRLLKKSGRAFVVHHETGTTQNFPIKYSTTDFENVFTIAQQTFSYLYFFAPNKMQRIRACVLVLR